MDRLGEGGMWELHIVLLLGWLSLGRKGNTPPTVVILVLRGRKVPDYPWQQGSRVGCGERAMWGDMLGDSVPAGEIASLWILGISGV